LTVIEGAIYIEDFGSIATVRLEQDAGVWIPQLHRLVTATGQAVISISLKYRILCLL
jgi:hypothetical protein